MSDKNNFSYFNPSGHNDRASGVACRKPKSISSFVAGYKTAVINKIDNWIDENGGMAKFNKQNPLWQSNYYDHIIRNEESYQRIRNYIIENPEKWETDDYNN